MHASEQAQVGARLLALLASGRNDNRGQWLAFDGQTYRDPQRARLEREQLPQRFPVLAALSGDLPQPGSWLACDHGPRPLLLTRAEDGVVRAFANQCRHRGAQLGRAGAAPCTAARRINCPYHGWSYGLDGALLGVPDGASFEGLPRETHGLLPLPVLERDGLVWAMAEPGREAALAAYVDSLCPDLRHYDLRAARHFSTVPIDGAFDWKLGMDTFLEAYHFAVLHRDSVATVFRPNLCTLDTYGWGSRGVLARHSLNAESLRADGLLPHCAAIYVLFPYTVFFWQGDHFEIWRVMPAAEPGRARLSFSLYAPGPIDTDSARRHWQANVDLALSVIEAEDFPIAAGIQRNLDAGAAPPVVVGANEASLLWFHAGLLRALRGEGPLQDLDQARATLRGAAPA
ncbi:MAG: aromatic ring-hydroxylating dioxygenase subunit alpha [Proteobacteria bacterium]|nr:aromatic ring-hydroxylating dioxygenase subunit alpha [Pseudomonadota bacterium]